MSELTYDPEYPYLVQAIDGEVISKHKTSSSAKSHLESALQGYGQVIDTTPKPKIPEDAEFIYYTKSGYDFYVRQLDSGDWKTDGGGLYSYPEILDLVSEASEVTVLVRKEDA